MRWLVILMFGLVTCGLAAEKAGSTFRFEKTDVGKLPADWKAEQSGEGKESEWKVIADKTAPSGKGHVLAQLARGPSRVFNLCVAEKTRYTNIHATVKFKAVAGRIDQGGGVMWRYQDANNYYICRYNPLEDNLRVYKVEKGKRIQLATQEEISLPAGKWHTLEITHNGDRIICGLNGTTYLKVTDNTFSKAGKIGLWTKADAQTSFDDLVVKEK